MVDLMSLDPSYDVLICGGGLAGLTLARQLKLELPSLSVAVIDRLTRPLPEAAHKVGEATTEIAGHYFARVLRLEDYLAKRQRSSGCASFSGMRRALLRIVAKSVPGCFRHRPPTSSTADDSRTTCGRSSSIWVFACSKERSSMISFSGKERSRIPFYAMEARVVPPRSQAAG